MDYRHEVAASKLKIGDEKELKLFYHEYFALFVAFANNLLASEEESKDVVHDVFASYWNLRNDFDDLISIRAFFYRTIRNKCLNIIRHKKVEDKYRTEGIERIENDDYIYNVILKKEIFYAIHQEIGQLTNMEQKVLLLSLEGKSNDEIAAELNVAVSTIKSHKANSYSELRKRLKYIRMLLLLC